MRLLAVMLLLAPACRQHVETKLDEQIKAVKADSDTSDSTVNTQIDTKKFEVKTQAPTQIEIKEIKETFGPAPAPTPQNPHPPQPLLTRETKDTIKKLGEVETQKGSAASAAKVEEKHEEKVETVSVKAEVHSKSLRETIVGLSLLTKLALGALALAVLLGVIAYVNPNWLGIPARAIKWLLSRGKP